MSEDDGEICTMEFLGHKHYVLSVLYFPPYDIIVSCSMDDTVRIWSGKRQECLKIHEHGGKCVNYVMKWDENSFVSCTEDGSIRSFSILPPYEEVNYFVVASLFGKNTNVHHLCKLGDDQFVALSQTKISIISYRQDDIIKEVKCVGFERIGYSSRIVKSKVLKSCFYITSGGMRHMSFPIYQVDYEQDKIMKEFKTHKSPMRAMVLYFNSAQEEILITSSLYENFIYFYNTNMNESTNCFMRIDLKSKPISSLLLFHNYLCVGQNGFFRLFYLSSDKVCSLVFEEYIHDDVVRDIKPVKIERESLELLTCSDDRSLKIVTFSNLRAHGRESQVKNDEKERTVFLIKYYPFLDMDEEEEEMIQYKDIQLINKRLENIFTVLLL